MRKLVKQIFEVLSNVGWALAHMSEAEMKYLVSQRSCSNCGHDPQAGWQGGLR